MQQARLTGDHGQKLPPANGSFPQVPVCGHPGRDNLRLNPLPAMRRISNAFQACKRLKVAVMGRERDLVFRVCGQVTGKIQVAAERCHNATAWSQHIENRKENRRLLMAKECDVSFPDQASADLIIDIPVE